MSYQKQTFEGGSIFTAAQLAHIEAGVAANDAKAAELTARANAIAAALDNVTGWGSYDETQNGRKRTSDNSYASLGVGMQAGDTLRIRNLQITKVGNTNDGNLHSFYIWGYPDAVFGSNTEHAQLVWRSAAQVAAGGEISVTASAAYGSLGVATNAKNGSGTEVTETFRIQFEYKIVPAASEEEEEITDASVHGYAGHFFQDGNDLYPDELDDMENQISADDTALTAAEASLAAAAAAAAPLLPWNTFSEAAFTGSQVFQCAMLKGQTLYIRNLSISLANDATPTAFVIKGCNASSYATDPGTQITRKTSFEDFQLVLEADYSYLRVNAVPSDVEQTVAFEYKVV